MHWLLHQLLVVAILLLTAEPNQSSVSPATVNVWAAVSLSECNATCPEGGTAPPSDGSQRVIFGCYRATSPGVRRIAGTRLFLAASTADQLPNDKCVDPVPPEAPTFVRCRRRSTDAGCRRPADYWWQLDELAAVAAAAATCQSVPTTASPAPGDAAAASGGATGCGHPGVAQLGLACRRRRIVPPATVAAVVEDARCLLDAGLPRPESPAVPCRRLLIGCRPVWKAGAWGACSRDCGLGEMARTVECSMLVDTPTDGPVYAPAPGKCADGDARPHSREYCVVQPDCPPYYRLRPGKCLPAFSAEAAKSRHWCNETGLRPTKAECVQLVGDAVAGLNQTLRRPTADCRRLARPPPFQRCRVDADTLAQRGIACVEPSDVVVTAPPRLLAEPPGSLLVQMERLPLMEARCGQSVTLIPGTRLRLHCSVANYKAADLHWRKLGRKRDFRSGEPTEDSASARESGGEKCGRICVNNGDLVFRRFKPRDAGTYEVTAGAAKASVQLTWHTAYDAFLRAYLPRAHLLRRLPLSSSSLASASSASGADGWAAEQPTLLARDALVWIAGAWSDCPCGRDRRERRRTVRCERLRSGAYSVVRDDLCARQLGPAPPAVEVCDRSCPRWRVGEWEGQCPASHCYLTGMSLELRSVTCRHVNANATLPDSECHQTGAPKPENARQCPNISCQPEWSVGSWSACSTSCGAFGFCSRRVQCLWQVTGLPAGLACEHLAMPRGYKSCYEGPCHLLGCLDLSPVCKIYQASALCAHPSLRKSCCATCNTYQLDVYRSLKRN